MAAAGGGRAVVLLQPVTFVTGNAKKLEEVRAILGNSIPFRSLKLDRTFQIHALLFFLCQCAFDFFDPFFWLLFFRNSARITRRAWGNFQRESSISC